ncbi:P-loop containing nucleoside triphosphate hydrolase protein [Fomitopsis serialis]|uniref:P-loop containing nucleoside triphosphate hydrolase protein n=1 Tax=Fomitopsis serialis TaxID=139415 RepID=UPI002008E00A|nr:P-loop containing nucleoside triphosphate hydrolase protein [Neoantrodia serialis]KAH9919106.1 P-loop containing nucleoside triphosphate hydrolase protein [Neoantrodia serialis]
MASKPKATATRASTRSKATASSAPATTRTTRAASKTNAAAQPSTSGLSAPKRTIARKPLLNRDNSPEPPDRMRGKKITASAPKPHVSRSATTADLTEDTDREPIKAYLRIRPHLGDAEPMSQPYLDPISDTAVQMTDPLSSSAPSRLSSAHASSIYTFSHIFPPETQQVDFFTRPPFPCGLLFTYGVTNSGKTYTIQGGSQPGSAGILPRTLDVIFNSIEGLHGDTRYRPVRLNGVELADGPSESFSPHLPSTSGAPALADILDDLPSSDGVDPTVLTIDRNHEYTIWLSYSEVYNEKSSIPRPTSSFLNLPLPSSQANPLLLTRKALAVKPCPRSDTGLTSSEAANGGAGKYVAGLRQLRVENAAQAKELLRLGQLHRRVFGTLANSQSSRSHALVTIKILRVHRGEKNDLSSIQTSRLTLVDLAGSERTKHTQTSGERLREAGNINKSLMVLGQCMETLRANQRTLARSLAASNGARVDTRDVKRGLAVVPFRHSKLTEILMDYFVGEGRAVMIVNVNPYDTGFDENSHVMRFAALAREVSTVPGMAIARVLPAGKARASEVVPHKRSVTLSTGGRGKKVSEAHLEDVEDEEPGDGDGDGEDEPINPLIDALFDEIERLRTQLFDAELRSAVVEAEVREEVMEEMEARMQSMEKMFKRRLMMEIEQHEKKLDAKIDMMNQARQENGHSASDSDEDLSDVTEDEVEAQMVSSSITRLEMTIGAPRRWLARERARTDGQPPNHYQGRDTHGSRRGNKPGRRMESLLPQDTESEVESEPPKKSGRPLPKHAPLAKAPSPVFEDDVKAGRAKARKVSDTDLRLQDKPRDSTTVIPDKKARNAAVAHGGQGAAYVPQEGEVDTMKKKSGKQLGKNRVVTDDEMAAIILGTSQEADTGKQLRRSARH